MAMKLGTASAAAPVRRRGRPPGSKNKGAEPAPTAEVVRPGATANPVFVAHASSDMPMWAEVLEKRWAILEERWAALEAKADKILSMIETEETAPAPKEPVVLEPKEPLAEAAIDEDGYVSVTVSEIEAMDLVQLVRLADQIGVDVANCRTSERITRKRIMVAISKSPEILEAMPRVAKT